MNTELATVLGRIEKDFGRLRSLLGANQAKRAKKAGVRMPELRGHYTAKEAEVARQQIEAAFQAGLIPYDKKRGMKTSVRKATEGWSPVKA